ncbi:MAG TPA: diguanylate cyclase [Sideroxyarcus sp.]|nr:diguanylate cyclase [Sideroxyarcus sp.]
MGKTEKLLHTFSTLLGGSILRQMVFNFSLAACVLMLGFGYLVLEQQRDSRYRLSEERAASLAHALAISGSSWMLANDLVGLQEVAQGFVKTPDLQRAYFLTPMGEVLASTNPDEIGFFVTDERSRAMLASTARDQFILVDQPDQIVVAHPVLIGGRHLGWTRVEMSRDRLNAELTALTRMWLKFILVSVLVVGTVAFLLARWLTRGLRHLMSVAAAVEQGAVRRRADITRLDEVGVLARQIDRMLDAIDEQKKIIGESEARYRFLADNISDVIWILNLDKNCWEYLSPSIVKLTGYTAEETMQQPPAHAFSAKSYADVQRWLGERSQLFRSGTDGSHVYTDEAEHLCRDGSAVWVEMTTHFSRNEQGDVIVLGVSRNISERKKAEEQIRSLAFYDPLTKLPNRRLLLDRFSLVISSCKRNNRYAALMFIDLDNFKPLNDKHGHDVGDILLIEAARRISSCVREVDTVARFGGDEFVVMLSKLDTDKDTSTAQAGGVAEKIRQILGEPYRLPVLQESRQEPGIIEHRCTASIGLVLFNKQATSHEDLLRLADTAMYQAKSAGRNRIHFADT